MLGLSIVFLDSFYLNNAEHIGSVTRELNIKGHSNEEFAFNNGRKNLNLSLCLSN
jgi:hypothetical protein